MNSCSEKTLLARLREGDEAGFEALVSSHAPRLIGLAWRLVGNREDGEDIAQEAFLRFHRHMDNFRGESSISTWLHRTVSRLAIDLLRRRKLRERIFFFRRDDREADPQNVVPDPAASPSERFFAGEIRQRLDRALHRLSARQRVVFTLRHYEEMPLKQIALLLGLEEGTVKAHLHRAVHILRRELKDLHEETP